MQEANNTVLNLETKHRNNSSNGVAVLHGTCTWTCACTCLRPCKPPQ